MESPPRGALMLVCFSAVAMAGLSALELLLYAVEQHQHQQSINIFHVVLLAIPIILGLVVLIRSHSVAEWISNKFDE
jgi:hypothetical protein